MVLPVRIAILVDCWAKALFGSPCEGRVDPAHIGFKHSYLKSRRLDKSARWDPRIIRPVCRRHHERLDGPTFHLWFHQLPASVKEYALEHDLTHLRMRGWHDR